MAETPLERLTTARSLLRSALADRDAFRRGSPVVEAGVAYLLELVNRWVSEVQADQVRQERAEVALVYATITANVTELVGRSDHDVLVALVELCDDDEARGLVKDHPRADPGLVELLRKRLVWVTVTYTAQVGQKSQRVVEIVHRAPDGELRTRKITHAIGWDDVPEDVRARVVRKDQTTVRFELFPPRN